MDRLPFQGCSEMSAMFNHQNASNYHNSYWHECDTTLRMLTVIVISVLINSSPRLSLELVLVVQSRPLNSLTCFGQVPP